MPLTIAPFQADDVFAIQLQSAQAELRSYFNDHYAHQLAVQASYTARCADTGRIIACAGLIPQDVHRALVWMMCSGQIGRQMIGLYRSIQTYLTHCPYQRLEAVIDPDFLPAKRWIRYFNFHQEGELTWFWPSGKSALLYARISNSLTDFQKRSVRL